MSMALKWNQPILPSLSHWGEGTIVLWICLLLSPTFSGFHGDPQSDILHDITIDNCF
jgi:hypothetical protein